MGYDKERITRIIGDLEKYFVDLDQLHLKSISDLNETKNFYSASMLIFSLMNRALDLGDEIVSSNKLGLPEKYRDIFSLLARAKIILKDIINYSNSYVLYIYNGHKYLVKYLCPLVYFQRDGENFFKFSAYPQSYCS